MPIDNAQAVQFVQDYGRPIAEVLVALRAKLDEAEGEWVANNLTALFNGANLTETVADSNESQHPVTGQDVIDWAQMVLAIKAIFDAPGDMNPIHRLQVRPLSVISNL
jgi:hypothetical protein